MPTCAKKRIKALTIFLELILDIGIASGYRVAISMIVKVTIYHILKLFQSPPGTIPPAVPSDFKKPLVSEFYEELIFQDPSAMMRQLLTNTRQLTLGEYKHDTDFEEKKEKTLKNVLSAKEKIANEIMDLREKIKLAKDTITKFKDEINKSQGDVSLDISGLS
nr:YEATS domain-containing protein 4-like [Cherax quadricarinatus]